MARTKSFDVDEVLDRAVDLFWVNGFAATSMEDLVNHLGINRGSLYATFNSKEELYRRALDRYRQSNTAWLADALADESQPLRERLAPILAVSAVSDDNRGCLMVNSATERNATHEETRAATGDAITQIRQLVISAFEAAASSERPGDAIVGSMTAQAAADLVVVAVQGLRVLSTADPLPGMVDNVVETTLAAIFGPATE